MKMDLSLQQRLEQKLILAPQIIQSIEILQLTVPELRDLVEKEVEENPFIETELQHEAPEPGTAESEAPEEKTETEPPSVEELERSASGEETQALQAGEADPGSLGWNDFASEYRGTRGDMAGKDRKSEAMQNTASRAQTLQEYLVEQVSVMELDDKTRELASNIIYNIDDAGYLKYSLEEVLASIENAAEKGFTPELAAEALRIVQSLEPAGIGGRDLKEVLILQLPEDEENSFTRFLIEHHLPDIEKNRLPKIARDTGVSLERIKEAVDFIRRLNPKPGSLFASGQTHYIMPDVVIESVDGDYEVRTESAFMPNVRISSLYNEYLQKYKDNREVLDFIKKKIESARWLIKAIEQRQNTVSRISREVVDFQKDFFEHGLSRLKPLKMQTIADRVGVHVSTVGRAISGKYIQTPRGIFPLKFFFTGGTTAQDGETESTRSVKSKIEELFRGEDKKSPLSDEEIVEKLKSAGLTIARRTITKYRKALGIPSSRQRKEF